MIWIKDIISAVLLLVLSGVLLHNLGEVPETAAYYPRTLIWLMSALVAVVLAKGIYGHFKRIKVEEDPDQVATDGASAGADKVGWPTVLVLGLSFIYLWAMPYIGFTASSALLLFIFMWAMGVRNWWVLILVPVVEIGVLLYVFESLLAVLLPDAEALRTMMGW